MNLPEQFKQQMLDILGENANDFFNSLEEDAPVSIRLNTAKKQVSSQAESIPWSQTGYYLDKRPLFTLDPLFHAGLYYVQEASSMFIEQAIKQLLPNQDKLKALDLCAAPGGKTTLLTSLLPQESLLVANEVIKSRSNILSENVQKWGSGNIVVTNNDPKDFSPIKSFFDIILVDAPCSGEGMFRKDKNARAEWSVENVQLCAERQQRILANIWDSLKPGGILVYSTCTFNTKENEENVKWMCEQLAAKSLPVNTKLFPSVVESKYEEVNGYRFYPHKNKGEGFFMAVVQKEGENTRVKLKKAKKTKVFENVPSDISKNVATWLKSAEKWKLKKQQDTIMALPSLFLDECEYLTVNLNVVYQGCQLAELKKTQLKPNHALSLFNFMSSDAFPKVELSLNEALQFLRKETLNTSEAPEGWICFTYQNIPIGFGKKIKQRVNNNYPKEWRIRMNIPTEWDKTEFITNKL